MARADERGGGSERRSGMPHDRKSGDRREALPVVAQWVQVTWTKASRGAPGAVRRNAVPTGLLLPSAEVPILHDVTAEEQDGFEPRENWHAVALGGRDDALPPVGEYRRPRHGHVLLRSKAGVFTVQLVGMRGWGYASPRRHPAVRLEPGQWVRWIVNHRFSGYRGWSYSQVILNLANGPVALDTFLGDPPLSVDERVSLF